MQSSAAFAKAIGYPDWPIDDLLVFHIVFGKTVPDVSLNAVANLGYAGMQFLAPVFAGDTLSATSEVIGLKENSNRKTGIVYVRTRGVKQDGTAVLEYVRWVMVRKRDESAPAAGRSRAAAADRGRAAAARRAPARRSTCKAYDFALAGSPHRFGDYAVGEKIDHVDGITVEEAEHQIATRLYQNTARIHFDQFSAAQGRFGTPADLRRPCHLARARDLVQRPRQRLPHRRHQRRTPRRAAVCGRHGVRMVGGAGGERTARAQTTSARCGCAPWRRKIGPARISHTRTARNTTPPFCSISITGSLIPR